MVLVLQAEDGIRDGHVTGVQTCALPISIFYVNASSGNNMMIRYNQYQHVYLGHGDSDKPPSYNPTHAMYAHIFAAGQGAIDRYASHGEVIQREQLDRMSVE